MTAVRDPGPPASVLPLALLALVCQALAWWWAYMIAGGVWLLGPVALGATSLALALLAPARWRRRARVTPAPKQSDSPARVPPAQSVQSARLQAATHSGQSLASSLDAMNIGLEIWDEQDCLILYNPEINRMHPGLHTPAHIGQPYDKLIRVQLAQKIYPGAIGNETVWLAAQLDSRGSHTAPHLLQLASGRWVNLHFSRSAEGCLVVAWVDVTELIHKDIKLESDNRRLIRQATTDELTGLANRRSFDQVLDTEWQRAARAGLPLSLLMVDIDHFKCYNDHYGHVAGDKCLRRVANVLDRCVRRAGEIVARYGGEEFVLLLPGSNLNHAIETAQNCQHLLQQEMLPHAASHTATHVTVSIGVACVLPNATNEPATLINAADAAMYRAKSTGRAHYEIADQSDWDIDPDTPRTQPGALA